MSIWGYLDANIGSPVIILVVVSPVCEYMGYLDANIDSLVIILVVVNPLCEYMGYLGANIGSHVIILVAQAGRFLAFPHQIHNIHPKHHTV